MDINSNEENEGSPGANEGFRGGIRSERSRDTAEGEHSEPGANIKAFINRNNYIVRFLCMWAASVATLVVISLVSNIDWARPQFERMLSQNLGRKVSLGHLSWNFSFNGMAIASSWLKVADLDQHSPFIKSAHAEIGIAFLPLFHRKVILQHLVMYRPEIWAVRLQPGKWNYSDLLDSIILTKFINAHDATIHIRDLVAQNNYDFQHVELRFVHPRAHKSWPFYLSAQLPRNGYTTTVSISALGNGRWKDWRANDYKFEIKAAQLNPKDLGPYAIYLPPITGMFDLDIKGQGSYMKSITGTADSTIRNLALPPRSKIVELPPLDLTFSTKFSLSGNPTNEISKSGTKVPKASNNSRMLLSLGKNPAGPRFTGHLSARQIAFNNVMAFLPQQYRPYMPAARSDTLSDVQGTVEVNPNRSVAVSGLTLSSPNNTKIVTDGIWNTNGSAYSLKLTGQNVDFGKIASVFPQIQDAAQHHASGIIAKSGGSVKFLGNINFTASTESSNGGNLSRLEGSFLNNTIDFGKDLEIKNLTGNVLYGDKLLTLNNVCGTMDGDKFTLDGTISYTGKRSCKLDLNASRVNLEHLSGIFNILGLNVPILNHNVLSGSVKALEIKVRGSSINVVFSPDNIYYHPQPKDQSIQAAGGRITYQNDSLELSSVDLILKQGRLNTSGLISGLNSSPELVQCQFKTSGVDLAEISYLLNHSFLPSSVQQEYKPYLSCVQLSTMHGKISMNINWRQPPQPNSLYKLDGLIGLSGASGRLNQDNTEFTGVSGVISASGNELILQNLKGMLGANKFFVKGSISDYQQPSASWQIDMRSRIQLSDALKLIPASHEIVSKLQSSGTFGLHAHLSGDKNNNMIVFSCHSDPADRLSVIGHDFNIFSPSSVPVSLDGTLLILGGNAGSVELKNCYLVAGKSILHATGKYGWYSEPSKDPSIDAHIQSVQPLLAQTLMEVLNRTTAQKAVAGTIYGSLDASGTQSKIEAKTFIGFSDLSFPQYNLKTASGTIDSPVWIVLNLTNSSSKDSGAVFGAQGSQANLKLTNLESGPLKITDMGVQLATQKHEDHIRIALKNGSAAIFDGTAHFAGWLDCTDHSLHLGLDAADIDANLAISRLLNHENEVSGKTMVTAVLDTSGTNNRQLVSNLSGHGAFRISDGMVYRFGHFQERISQVNLLHQGVFGFNLNNLLQSMVPVRNGKFNDLAGTFEIQKGIVSFNDLRYDADDMRLWAAGTANLPLDTLEVEVAGRIPRVAPSIIGGPMGKFSRTITVQNFVDIVTLHKLESLPSLPILGDIANDRPRTFSFKILGPLDKPHSISQSIEKTFAWLPAMPGASAHPLPALAIP